MVKVKCGFHNDNNVMIRLSSSFLKRNKVRELLIKTSCGFMIVYFTLSGLTLLLSPHPQRDHKRKTLREKSLEEWASFGC